MDGRQNILFVGRPEKRKGLKYLLRAYIRIKEQEPNTRLIVVGAGDFSRYERLMAPIGDVVFRSYVPYDELPRYHRSSQVFCAPNTGNESQGYVLLEAMAAGVPVVASNIEGFAGVITDQLDGVLVKPKDSDEIGAAILRLLRNPAQRAELSARGTGPGGPLQLGQRGAARVLVLRAPRLRASSDRRSQRSPSGDGRAGQPLRMPKLNVLSTAAASRDSPTAWGGASAGSVITPNMISLFGFAGNVFAAYLIVREALPWAGVVFLVFSALDMLDGAVARATGSVTRFGAVFDAILDRASEALVLSACAWYFGERGEQVQAAVTYAALFGSVAVSYMRARAEVVGLSMRDGLFRRQERVALLAAGLFLNGLTAIMWPLAILSNVTALQRFAALRRGLAPKD